MNALAIPGHVVVGILYCALVDAQSPVVSPTGQPNQSDERRPPRWAQTAGIAIFVIIIILIVCCFVACCFRRQLRERYEVWRNPEHVHQPDAYNNNNRHIQMTQPGFIQQGPMLVSAGGEAPLMATVVSPGGTGMVYGADGKPIYH